MNKYSDWLEFFKLDKEEYYVSADSCNMCYDMDHQFPSEGSAWMPKYFVKSEEEGKCKLSTDRFLTSGYSLYTRDDYKRCVCDHHGDGEADCSLADSDDEDEYTYGVSCTNPEYP